MFQISFLNEINFEKPIIVMEDLDVTVKRQSKNKKQNYLLSVWARRKLQNFIEYKAKCPVCRTPECRKA